MFGKSSKNTSDLKVETEKKKLSKWKKGSFGCLGIILLFFVVGIMASGGESKTAYSIGFTPDKFQEQFNLLAKEINSPVTIPILKIEEGDVQNVAGYNFCKTIGITCAINKKDGNIRYATLLYNEPDRAAMMSDSMEKRIAYNNDSQILNAVRSQFIYTISPELKDSDGMNAFNLLHELGATSSREDLKKIDKEVKRGDKIYYLYYSKAANAMAFGVRNEKDKSFEKH